MGGVRVENDRGHGRVWAEPRLSVSEVMEE